MASSDRILTVSASQLNAVERLMELQKRVSTTGRGSAAAAAQIDAVRRIFKDRKAVEVYEALHGKERTNQEIYETPWPKITSFLEAGIKHEEELIYRNHLKNPGSAAPGKDTTQVQIPPLFLGSRKNKMGGRDHFIMTGKVDYLDNANSFPGVPEEYKTVYRRQEERELKQDPIQRAVQLYRNDFWQGAGYPAGLRSGGLRFRISSYDSPSDQEAISETSFFSPEATKGEIDARFAELYPTLDALDNAYDLKQLAHVKTYRDGAQEIGTPLISRFPHIINPNDPKSTWYGKGDLLDEVKGIGSEALLKYLLDHPDESAPGVKMPTGTKIVNGFTPPKPPDHTPPTEEMAPDGKGRRRVAKGMPELDRHREQVEARRLSRNQDIIDQKERNSKYWGMLNKAWGKDPEEVDRLKTYLQYQPNYVLDDEGQPIANDTVGSDGIKGYLTKGGRWGASQEFDSYYRQAEAAAAAQKAIDEHARSLQREQAAEEKAGRQELRDHKKNMGQFNSVMGSLGDTEAQWYDWRRWQDAREQGWSGISSSARGVVPEFLRRPVDRFVSSALEFKRADVDSLWSKQMALQKGVIPMLASLGNFAGSMHAVSLTSGLGGAMAGGAGVGGAVGGLPGAGVGAIVSGLLNTGINIGKAAFQIKGQLGEGQIKSVTSGIRAKFDFWGGVLDLGKTVHGVIHNIIMTPLKLFGSLLKVTIGSLAVAPAVITHFLQSLTKAGVKGASTIGTPLLALTDTDTRTGWHNYWQSRGVDWRAGLSDGATQSLMENMESAKQNFYGQGMVDQLKIVSSSLLRQFESFFGAPGEEKVASYDNLNSLMASLLENPESLEKDYIMTMLGNMDTSGTLQKIYETLLEANEENTKVTDLDTLTEFSGSLGSEIRSIQNRFKSANEYRTFLAEYGAVQQQKSLADADLGMSVWRTFTKPLTKWVTHLTQLVSNGSIVGGSSGYLFGGAWQEIMETVLAKIKEYGPKIGPAITDALAGLAEAGDRAWESLRPLAVSLLDAAINVTKMLGSAMLSGIREIAPTVMHLYANLWLDIAFAGLKAITKAADTSWVTILGIIEKMGNVHVDLGKLIDNWFTGGNWSMNEIVTFRTAKDRAAATDEGKATLKKWDRAADLTLNGADSSWTQAAWEMLRVEASKSKYAAAFKTAVGSSTWDETFSPVGALSDKRYLSEMAAYMDLHGQGKITDDNLASIWKDILDKADPSLVPESLRSLVDHLYVESNPFKKAFTDVTTDILANEEKARALVHNTIDSTLVPALDSLISSANMALEGMTLSGEMAVSAFERVGATFLKAVSDTQSYFDRMERQADAVTKQLTGLPQL